MARVLVRVLDVTPSTYRKDRQEKKKVDMILKSGKDAITCTMYDGDVSDAKHKLYESQLGKEIIVDLSPECFRGNLQWRLGFEAPELLDVKSPAPIRQAS